MSTASPDTAERSWTVLELLRWTTEYFGSLGIESARLDAECLLASALEMRRLDLYVEFEKPVLEAERARFRELVRRRGRDRVPVSQLLGRREFWSLSFAVTADVLTPRPETETLVEAALSQYLDPAGELRVLDIGTGSGAIALSIASERPGASVTATEISQAALQIARQNAEELQLDDRVRFLEGSLFEPVQGERFDLVLSNPPYLAEAEADSLAPELAHEPKQALFAGSDGLGVLGPLVAGLGEVLEPGGWAAVEIDPSQADRVAASFSEAGFERVERLRDLAGSERAVAGRWPECVDSASPRSGSRK